MNNTGFGFAIAAFNANGFAYTYLPNIHNLTITVYYTLASGFTVTQDCSYLRGAGH